MKLNHILSNLINLLHKSKSYFDYKKIFLQLTIISITFITFAEPSIKICNFSGQSVDVLIGDVDNSELEIYDLENTEATGMLKDVKKGSYHFYFRTNEGEWLTLTDDNGNKTKNNFLDNGIYLIVFGFSGLPYFIELTSNKKTDNGIFYILNESGREINKLKVTDDWEYDEKGLTLNNISTGELIGPNEVNNGKWKIMWSYSDDPKEDRYFIMPTINQKKEEVPLIVDYKSTVKNIMIIYRAEFGESAKLIGW